jgi:hypothetical protein
MQKKLDPIEIAALREAGFSLAPVAGQGDERYTRISQQDVARLKPGATAKITWTAKAQRQHSRTGWTGEH